MNTRLCTLLFLVAFVMCLSARVGAGETPSASTDLSTHPVRNIAYWGTAWRDTPLSGRVAPAPAEVAEYIELDNLNFGIEGEVSPTAPPKEIGPALEDIAAALPTGLAGLLRDRLTGVFTVTGLGSSGYIEEVTDDARKLQAVFLVLDSAVFLGRTANAWAGWRESSFFTAHENGQPQLSMTIEETADDTVYNAVRYILLHELGHCLGAATRAHPSWNAGAADLSEYPFVQLSWQVEDGAYVRKYAADFPYRMRLYAFDDSEFSLQDAPSVYAACRDYTNAPSVYGTVTPFEDFAESFATYQHAVREGRPWSVTLELPSGEMQTFTTCYQAGTCPEKKTFMQEWFAGKWKQALAPSPPPGVLDYLLSDTME